MPKKITKESEQSRLYRYLGEVLDYAEYNLHNEHFENLLELQDGELRKWYGQYKADRDERVLQLRKSAFAKLNKDELDALGLYPEEVGI